MTWAPSLPFYVMMGLAVVILGLSKGGFTGLGMVSTPLVALVAGPTRAAALILPILLIQDTIAVAMFRKSFERRVILSLAPGAAAGIALSYVFSSLTPAWVLEVLLGALSIGFAAWMSLGRLPAAGPPRPAIGWACGIASGFTSTVANAGTLPYQFYVLPLNLERDVYIGTSAIFFGLLNLAKVAAFAGLGQFTAEQLRLGLWFAPLAVVSSWAGGRLARRIDTRRFNLIVRLLLIGVGALLLYRGLRGWNQLPQPS